MEHHSNIVPWHFIRERQGAKLVWVPVDDEGAFHIEEFEKCLTERTKLVAITHMSNALGTVVPVKEICRIAHERGIPVLVDGSQGAVHMPVDVQDIDCDWYVMTGHKLYGPSGIGVLYGKKDRLSEMRPFQGGGEMIVDVTEDIVTYNEPPHRFRGRHAADRPGDRPRLCARLHGKDRPRGDRAPRGGSGGLCGRAAACHQFAAGLRQCARQGRYLLVRAGRASTPMTSRR
jgi:hypothetical protein